MWVYLRDAFLSIVEDRHNAQHLLVRARIKGDIERVFAVEVERTPDADYHYRASIDRARVGEALADAAEYNIDYPNFKHAVGAIDPAREALYHNVWAASLKGAAAIDQYLNSKSQQGEDTDGA